MKTYYNYIYIDPQNRQPFYVGKGTKRRVHAHLRDANSWRKGTKEVSEYSAKKYEKILEIQDRGEKPEIIVLFETEDESAAYETEKHLIQFFGRVDIGTGTLFNQNDGGGGAGPISDIRREKMRQRMTGPRNHMFGKTHSPEAIKKISERFKGKPGHPHTEEHKERMRKDNAGGKAAAKPIYQIDSAGNIVKEWPAASHAARHFGISKGNICQQAKDGSISKLSGFWWRYVGSKDICNGKLDVQKFTIPRGKGVVAIHEETGEIRSWPSVLAAARELNIRPANIYSAKQYNRIQTGFRWK